MMLRLRRVIAIAAGMLASLSRRETNHTYKRVSPKFSGISKKVPLAVSCFDGVVGSELGERNAATRFHQSDWWCRRSVADRGADAADGAHVADWCADGVAGERKRSLISRIICYPGLRFLMQFDQYEMPNYRPWHYCAGSEREQSDGRLQPSRCIDEHLPGDRHWHHAVPDLVQLAGRLGQGGPSSRTRSLQQMQGW